MSYLFFNFVNVSFRNWPVWIPVGSQKVVLNEGILKNFIEQTQPKIKFKNIILLKFCLYLSATLGDNHLLNLGVCRQLLI